jgi:hypothetical protein
VIDREDLDRHVGRKVMGRKRGDGRLQRNEGSVAGGKVLKASKTAGTLSIVLKGACLLLPLLLSLALNRNLRARGNRAVGTNPGVTRSRRRSNRGGGLADGRNRSSRKAHGSHSGAQTSGLDVRSDLVKVTGSGLVDVGWDADLNIAVAVDRSRNSSRGTKSRARTTSLSGCASLDGRGDLGASFLSVVGVSTPGIVVRVATVGTGVVQEAFKEGTVLKRTCTIIPGAAGTGFGVVTEGGVVQGGDDSSSQVVAVSIGREVEGAAGLAKWRVEVDGGAAIDETQEV